MCLDYTLLDPSGASLHAPALQTSIIPCTPPPPCASYGHPERRGQAGLAPQHAESTKETAAVWGRQAAEHKTAQKCCPHQCSATSCWGASESRGISVQLSRETREVLQAPRAASFTQVLLLLSYTATHSCSKENQIQPVATLMSSLLAAILLRSPAPIQTLAPSSLLAAAPVSSRGDPLLLGSFTGTQTEAGAAPLQDCNMDRDTMVTKCSERRPPEGTEQSIGRCAAVE